MLAQISRLDRRVLWGGAAAGVVLVAGVIAGVVALSGGAPPQPQPAASPTPLPTATPIRARATPPGTPAPRPSTFVGLSASVPVKVPAGPLPTPTPEAGLWRIEGYVVDESGQPIENVCVVIGPVPCQRASPKTDERGHYFIDVAAIASSTVSITMDFYFEIPGRETKWLRVAPTSSTVFNLVLKKA